MQEVIERGRYDEEDYKIDKRSEERPEEIIDMYEDIPTHLEPVYSAKSAKVAKEIKKKRKKVSRVLCSFHKEETQ